MPDATARRSRLVELVTARLQTADDLAAALDVHPRTVYRDVVALRAAGVDVRASAGVGYMLTRHAVPTRPGFWWAQWRKADPGTRDGEENTPSDKWEPVEVFRNADDPAHPEHLRVLVIGVERGQCLENFTWGPEIAPYRSRMHG